MTLARLIATGSGSLAARLEIEGLPIEFVSDPAMEQTLSDGRRRVYCINLFSGDEASGSEWGFAIDETVNIPEASLESVGSSVQLFETAAEDLAQAFLYAPDVDRVLTAAVTYNATTLSVLSESGFSAGDVVHVGTEAIKVGSVSAGTLSGCTRQYWGTTAQAHWTYGDGPELSYAHVTNRPMSVRGRRARVYLYGDGDDLAGDGGNSGDPVWRGFVTANPRCDDVGSTWFVQLGPLTDALKSRLGGELEAPMSPRGIYYSWAAPLYVSVTEEPTTGSRLAPYALFAGFYETQTEFIDALNTWLASTFSILSSQIRAVAAEGGRWDLEVIKGTGVDWLAVTVNSLQDGRTAGGQITLIGPDGEDTDGADWSTGTTFTLNWINEPQTPPGARQVPRGYFGNPGREPAERWTLPGDAATWPENRVYLDGPVRTDWGAIGAEWPVYPGDSTRDAREHRIRDSDTSDNWVELHRAPTTTSPPLYVYTRDLVPQFRPVRTLAVGNLAAFRDALVVEGRDYANRGTAPFITSDDLANWAEAVSRAARLPTQARRAYTLAHPIKLDEMLSMECRFLALYPITDSTGKIALAPIVAPTTNEPATDIDDEVISVGWSSLSRGNQTINRAVLSLGYEAQTDARRGPEHQIVNLSSYQMDHQDRRLDIAPFSTAIGDASMHYEEAATVALPVLALFGYPHDFVRVNVSWKLFDLRLGDVVTFSADHLPDYRTGLRPISSVVGRVVGRRWPIGAAMHGELTILLSWANVAGYSPTARVTGTSGSGTAWTLTVNPTLYAPTSPLSGSVAANVDTLFAVGDRVRAVQYDSASPTTVLGTINAIDTSAHTIGVTFDSTFTPGASTWELIFAPYDDASIQAGQKTYAAIAGTDGILGASDNPRTYGA